MKNVKTYIGKISEIKKINNSSDGNPRYQFVINGYNGFFSYSFPAKTGVNSMLGYSITNYDGKLVEATLGTHYNSITLDSIKLIED